MIKVLKTAGKVIAWFFAIVFSFLVLCCIAILLWSAVQRNRGSVMDLPDTPADFVPAVRIVTFTDPHTENENVANMIDTCYALFDNNPIYKGVDAFIGLGDFTGIGTEPDYESYTQVINAHTREETPFINILGNHEMKSEDHNELFKKYFGYDPNSVTDINGFTCIGFSGERGLLEWTFTTKSLKWLSDSVKDAEAKSNGKPVFVFQHPHPFGTVYGSTVWCGFQTNPILAGNTNLICFSGHSHFPMDDPKSINQSTYTAVGVGGMARFELDNRYIVGQHPDGYDTAAEFCVIEADNDGSVRLLEYDLNSGSCFNEYYIDNVNDRSSYAYTYKNMKKHDTTPVFPAGAEASATRNEDGEWVVSFNDAESSFIVHDYKITIKDENGKKIFSKNFVNDYYVHDGSAKAALRVGNDTLEKGNTYTLTVIAKSAYHLKSEPMEFTLHAH